MILHLVRHGQTLYNLHQWGLGRADVPLTEVGEQQAMAVAGRFEHEAIDAIFTSPLQRSCRMAEVIANGRDIDPTICDTLIELDVGDTEGMTFPEMRQKYPDFFVEWAGDDAGLVRMPGGERLADVDERISAFLEYAGTSGAEQAIVSTHNFVVKLLLCRLLGLGPTHFRAFDIDVASITTVNWHNGRVTIRSLNDRCHLAHLESSRRDG